MSEQAHQATNVLDPSQNVSVLKAQVVELGARAEDAEARAAFAERRAGVAEARAEDAEARAGAAAVRLAEVEMEFAEAEARRNREHGEAMTEVRNKEMALRGMQLDLSDIRSVSDGSDSEAIAVERELLHVSRLRAEAEERYREEARELEASQMEVHELEAALAQLMAERDSDMLDFKEMELRFLELKATIAKRAQAEKYVKEHQVVVDATQEEVEDAGKWRAVAPVLMNLREHIELDQRGNPVEKPYSLDGVASLLEGDIGAASPREYETVLRDLLEQLFYLNTVVDWWKVKHAVAQPAAQQQVVQQQQVVPQQQQVPQQVVQGGGRRGRAMSAVGATPVRQSVMASARGKQLAMRWWARPQAMYRYVRAVRPVVRRSAAVQSTPVMSAQVRATPVMSSRVKPTPVMSTPIRSTPVRATPVRSTPVRATPVRRRVVPVAAAPKSPVQPGPMYVVEQQQQQRPMYVVAPEVVAQADEEEWEDEVMSPHNARELRQVRASYVYTPIKSDDLFKDV